MPLSATIVISLVGGLFGGGALLRFFEFLIKRNDQKEKDPIMERFDTLDTKIDSLEVSFNEKIVELHKELEFDSADNARIRILKFSEETQRGQMHSKEAYDQVHDDINRYKAHCVKYPDYPNSRADMAIKHIETLYLEALELENEGRQGFLS